MLIKNNKLLISFLLLVIIPTTYKLGTILLSLLNLVFRDWVVFLFIIMFVCSFVFFIIQGIIFLDRKISSAKNIKNSIKIFLTVVVTILSTTLVLGTLAIGGLAALFTMGEVGVEIHNSKKYIVRQEGFLDPFYSYYEYKNLFIRDKESAYSGQLKWGEKVKEDVPTKDTLKIKDISEKGKNENLDKEVPVKENKGNEKKSLENFRVPSSEVEFICDVKGKTKYGLYLTDAAIGSRVYAFVSSEDGGVTWKAEYLFPVGKEAYKMFFVDQDTGFLNIDAENLNIYMTRDKGKTWEKININLPENKKDYKFLNNVEKINGKIVLTLGYPHWAGATENIRYYTEDQGKNWNLEGEKK